MPVFWVQDSDQAQYVWCKNLGLAPCLDDHVNVSPVSLILREPQRTTFKVTTPSASIERSLCRNVKKRLTTSS